MTDNPENQPRYGVAALVKIENEWINPFCVRHIRPSRFTTGYLTEIILVLGDGTGLTSVLIKDYEPDQVRAMLLPPNSDNDDDSGPIQLSVKQVVELATLMNQCAKASVSEDDELVLGGITVQASLGASDVLDKVADILGIPGPAALRPPTYQE